MVDCDAALREREENRAVDDAGSAKCRPALDYQTTRADTTRGTYTNQCHAASKPYAKFPERQKTRFGRFVEADRH